MKENHFNQKADPDRETAAAEFGAVHRPHSGPSLKAGDPSGNECAQHRVDDSYKNLFFNNHAVMLVIDPQSGAIIDANPAASRFYGYTRAELIGKPISSINTLSQADVTARMRQSVNQEEQHFFFQHRMKNGEIRDVEVYSGPIEMDGRQLLYSIIHDISKRKKAEEALRRSEEQLQQMNRTLELKVRQRTRELTQANQTLKAKLDELNRTRKALLESDQKLTQVLGNSVDIIYRRNYRTGTYDYVSPAINSLLGYRPDELTSHPWETIAKRLIHPDDFEKTLKFFQEIRATDAAGQYHLDYRLKHRDGSSRWVSDSFTYFRDDKGNIIYRVGNIRDVTEKKRIEEELKESEERFRQIAVTIDDVFWMFSPAANELFYVSPAYEKIWRRNPQALYEDPSSLMQTIHPDDRGLIIQAQKREARGDATNFEFRMLRPDGTLRWIHARGFPVKNEAGGGKVIIGIASDITERKKAEETMNDYAKRLESLNSELQNFSFIASHDLREPLRKIRTFGNFIKDKYSGQLDEKGQDYFRRMIDSAERMDSLLSALLAYSRLSTRKNPFVATSLSTIVQDAISDLELVIEASGGEISTGPLPTIEADPDQMRQLFQNLISNALKYRHKDISPRVTITSHSSGRTCSIRIKDNGIGLDESKRDRIFLPFERLHSHSSEYEGIGMGLAICRKIVERHGGEITVQSREGEGSTFIVTLPLSQERP